MRTIRYTFPMGITKWKNPLGVAAPRGFFHLLVLAVLVLAVKPLADAVGNHTCCDGQNE